MGDKPDLYQCIYSFVREEFPALETRRANYDQEATQIRINNHGSLIAIYEKWPHKIFYIAQSPPESTPALGRLGPNDSWNIVECSLGDPEYFNILAMAIKAAQFNQKKRVFII